MSPSNAGPQALAEYDANKDGALDAKELEACPGLRSGLKRIDKNNDGRLTANEISDRVGFLQREGTTASIGVAVTLDGQPLSGATVTLVPEKFMGASAKPVSAVTDAAGSGMLKAEGSGAEETPPGFYRVEITKKNAKGQEILPARYNTKTVLGQEIAPDAAEGRSAVDTVTLSLKSK